MKSGTAGFRPCYVQDWKLADRVSQLPKMEHIVIRTKTARFVTRRSLLCSMYFIFPEDYWLLGLYSAAYILKMLS